MLVLHDTFPSAPRKKSAVWRIGRINVHYFFLTDVILWKRTPEAPNNKGSVKWIVDKRHQIFVELIVTGLFNTIYYSTQWCWRVLSQWVRQIFDNAYLQSIWQNLCCSYTMVLKSSVTMSSTNIWWRLSTIHLTEPLLFGASGVRFQSITSVRKK